MTDKRLREIIQELRRQLESIDRTIVSMVGGRVGAIWLGIIVALLVVLLFLIWLKR